MTLSGWFKSYVYIPLGGNRKGTARCIVNLLIVWSLTGLWHGAGWNFMAWGLYFAVLLIMEKYLLKGILDKIPSAVRHIVTVMLIMISWVIFAVEDSGSIIKYFSAMFGLNGQGFITEVFLYNIRNYGVIIGIGVILSTPIYKVLEAKVATLRYKNIIYGCAAAGFIGLFIVTVSNLVMNTYNPFLYFRF